MQYFVKGTEYCTLCKWCTETRESIYIICCQEREYCIACDWGSESRESCYIRCEGSRVFMRLGPNLSPGLQRGVEDSQLGGYILYLHTYSTCFICINSTPYKGSLWQDFYFRLFSWIIFSRAPEYPVWAISNFYENSRRYSIVKVDNRCQPVYFLWHFPAIFASIAIQCSN